MFSKIIALFLVCFVTCFSFCRAQNKETNLHPPIFPIIHCIDSSLHCKVIDSLDYLYGRNKNIPEKYKLAILIALSYYPELTQTPIDFKECAIKTTLNARPTLSSLCFKNKTKRKYVVRINNSTKEGMITIDEIPFNASIGIFAHEFSHFVDYQNRSFKGVLQRLWAYSSKKRKAIYEKEIDSMTVARGLKWQMYDWSYYAIYFSKASESYKLFKQTTYLQPQEILQQVLVEEE